MDIPVLHITTLHLSGITTDLTSSQSRNYSIIRSTWQTFNGTLKTLNLRRNSNWCKYGVTFRTAGKLYYMAAIEGEPIHPLLKTFTIPGGHFARFHHTGPMPRVIETVADIYRIHLPESNLTIDPDRALIHYERYDSRFHWNREDSMFSILVPIVATQSKT